MRVAIIGAGAAGLTCTKSLIENGIEPVVFEKGKKIGGLWNYNEEIPGGGGPAYRSLIANTSKYMMAFSDDPFREDVPDFPSRNEVLDYLNSYAEKFELIQHVRFNHTVVKAEKLHRGPFILTTRVDGQIKTYEADWLIIANGRHEKIFMPPVTGLETFPGEIMHSRGYTVPHAFKGKKVLVAGAASSALDIASEVAEESSLTCLSVRNASWLVPRVIEGKAYDLHLTRLSAALPKTIRQKAFKKKLLKAYGKYSHGAVNQYYGKLGRPLDLDKHRFVPNDLMLQRIDENKVILKPVIKNISGPGVTFENGSVETFDAIIFATGYTIDIPFLDDRYTGLKNNYIPLYKQVFSPIASNLAMCGMCYIVGPILPALEMQGRFIASVIKGYVGLPAMNEMNKKVNRHFNTCQRLNISPMRVQTLSYLDQLAREIAVSPKLLLNMRVALRLLTGPIVPARYRLNGKNSSKVLARKLLKKL